MDLDTFSELPSGVEYRKVPGFPGYCVGDDGSAWSCRNIGCKPGIGSTWRKLKQSSQLSGHLSVTLYRGRKGDGVICRVHRLVMLAFVGPCPEGMQVRHLDGDPKNNRLGNLAYGTQLENAADAIRHGVIAHGERNGTAILTKEKVQELRRNWKDGATCDQLAMKFGISRATAHKAAIGKTWARVDDALAALSGRKTPGLFGEE